MSFHEFINFSADGNSGGGEGGIDYNQFLDARVTEDVMDVKSNLLQTAADYLTAADVREIDSAYDIAYYYHKSAKQYRGTESEKDGLRQKKGQFQEYMVHPGRVAQILADWRCDRDTIIAGLFHDTLEDTELKDNPEI